MELIWVMSSELQPSEPQGLGLAGHEEVSDHEQAEDGELAKFWVNISFTLC